MKKIDTHKIDEAVLALLYFNREQDRFGNLCAFKDHAWEALDRLHENGMIGNAKNKKRQLDFTPEGFEAAREAFERLFMVEE